MVLKAPDGTNLRTYYNRNQVYVGNCKQDSHTHWWGFTPYNIQETIYWAIRMLALPLAATVIFIIIFQVGLGSFENPIIQYVSYILLYIANTLLTSYAREVARAQLYKIRESDGLLDEREANALIDKILPPYTIHLNKIDPVLYEIGFVGDIMMMRDHDLVFHNDIINFFIGVNLIVGNLEGIVRAGGPTLTTQAHDPLIIDQLQRLLPNNTEWLLCLSNNHSIDFGNIEFHEALNQIHPPPNTYLFGRNDVSNVIIQISPIVQINISTATQWSNQHNWDCISRYEDANINNGFRTLYLNNQFNIMFPHWSYENERYVRPSIQSHARTLLTGQDQIVPPGENSTRWDLIFGQHPHVRQPIMMVNDTTPNDIPYKKLVVFSGGNFTSGVVFIRARKHLYGTIMRCQIGYLTDDPKQLAIGDVRWQRTVNERTTIGNVKTKQVCIDTGIYRMSNTTLLIIAITLIASIILVRVLEMFL